MNRLSSGTSGLGTRPQHHLAGKRFLVVDDEPYMIEVVGEILRHFGATEIVRACSVDAALNQCRRGARFDCIVSDFNMRPTNGLRLLQMIRAGAVPSLPRDQCFILLTGHAEIDVVKVAKALDANAYLIKPVSADTMIKAVVRALDAPCELAQAASYGRVPVAMPHALAPSSPPHASLGGA
jgi:two-component system response regulator RegA